MLLSKYYKLRKLAKGFILYSVLILFGAIYLFPLVFTFISSFKSQNEIFISPFMLPSKLSFTNYSLAWQTGIGVSVRNSLILALSTVTILIVIGTMASYILAKFNFKMRSFIYVFIIMGMMISIYATIIPLAYMLGQFNLRNNYPILILIYTAFQCPLTIFILTGFIKTIPSELEEAAIIDGCSMFKVYSIIIIPIATPAIATVSIFNFLHVWNNLLFPLVFISKPNLKPVSISLLVFFSEGRSDYGGVMAAVVIVMMPTILVYILLQEKVEKGLTAGAVKG